jgi:hypothetical protein
MFKIKNETGDLAPIWRYPASFTTVVPFQIIRVQNQLGEKENSWEARVECQKKDELEQHLSDVRILAKKPNLTEDEQKAAVRAERFAIGLVREHDTSGHDGKRCPFATRM